MRVWRVRYPSAQPHELGAEWTTTKREADRLAHGGRGYAEPVEVPVTKREMVAFLNKWA